MTNQDQYWQKFDEAFFNDGYNLCDAYLLGGFTKENLFAAQKHLYKKVDELIVSFSKRTEIEGKPVACKRGCSFCCQQTVLASSYELFYLAEFIKKKFPSNALKGIIQKVEDKNTKTEALKLSLLLRYKASCPLLHSTGGFCMAYQARPIACRIYLSSTVKSCEDDLNTPNDDSVYPALFEMPLRAGRMMNEGFQARLRKGRENSLQVFENSIEKGLLIALDNQAFDQWKSGKKIFNKL